MHLGGTVGNLFRAVSHTRLAFSRFREYEKREAPLSPRHLPSPLATDAFGTMATMATLFAGGRILTRRSSMGARATFRGFNDAKSARLEVRVDAHGRAALSADAIFSARTGVHARGAGSAFAMAFPRRAVHRMAGWTSDLHHHMARIGASPTYTTVARVPVRARAGSRNAPVRTCRGGSGALAGSDDVHRRDPRCRGAPSWSSRKKLKEDPAAANSNATESGGRAQCDVAWCAIATTRFEP